MSLCNVNIKLLNDQQCLDGAIEVERACFAKPLMRLEFKRQVQKKSRTTKVALIGRKVVGYIAFDVDKYVTIARIAVLPEYNRQGVGTLLVQSAVAKMNRRRPRLKIHVPEKNLAALKFFASCGIRASFVEWGYFRDQDSFLMEKFFEEEMADVSSD